MTIDPQTLTDVIIAVVTTIGIAVAFSLALVGAGTLAERSKVRPVRVTIPADHPEQISDSRKLVLR